MIDYIRQPRRGRCWISLPVGCAAACRMAWRSAVWPSRMPAIHRTPSAARCTPSSACNLYELRRWLVAGRPSSSASASRSATTPSCKLVFKASALKPMSIHQSLSGSGQRRRCSDGSGLHPYNAVHLDVNVVGLPEQSKLPDGSACRAARGRLGIINPEGPWHAHGTHEARRPDVAGTGGPADAGRERRALPVAAQAASTCRRNSEPGAAGGACKLLEERLIDVRQPLTLLGRPATVPGPRAACGPQAACRRMVTVLVAC